MKVTVGRSLGESGAQWLSVGSFFSYPDATGDSYLYLRIAAGAVRFKDGHDPLLITDISTSHWSNPTVHGTEFSVTLGGR
jgi:hypothetical protein